MVSAIRTMYSRAGRRVSIIGHSQGGMVGRWQQSSGSHFLTALNSDQETFPGISTR
jgi:hypothetical protein